MTTMAPPRPAERHGSRVRCCGRCRVRLATGPAAAAEARRRVRDAIASWRVPVDEDAALLLTSELVTNAVRHEAGQVVMLVITCAGGQLRIDVHDTSRSLPAVADVPAVAGHVLITTLQQKGGRERYSLTRLHATGGIGRVWLARGFGLVLR